MPIGLLVAGAASLGSAIFKGISAGKQRRAARKINPVNPVYSTSPYAKTQYGLAQQMLNGRMAGAAAQEQNIMGAQGNMMYNVGQNATDSSQALAMAAASQGQTNQAFSNLGQQEAQNKYGMLNNFNLASNLMTSERDKIHNDQVRKYNSDMQLKQGLQNAAMQNTQGIFGDVMNIGSILGAGGFMGGGGRATPSNFNTPVVGGASFMSPASLPQYQQFPGNYTPSWIK